MEGGTGSDGQIIGEYSFQKPFSFSEAEEKYSSLEIKRCGPFHVFKPQ